VRHGPRPLQDAGGMTLVEVLVATAISSLVLLIAGGLYVAALNMERRSRTMRELGDVSIAMEFVTSELRQTSRHPGSVIMRDDAAEDGRRRVIGVLSTRRTGWTYFIYDPARGELRRIESAGESPVWPPPAGGRVLARHFTAFDVVYDGRLFTVTMAAEKNGQKVRLDTQVWPRND
jgi:prepilin-type N-terminal cleavage/methylation domain-containing protein